MLKKLDIENFIFFKKISIKFHSGFNVFTGETGAGKTIFLNALNLTLGEKFSGKIIRAGESKVRVTSTFDINHRPDLKARLKQRDLPDLKGDILTLTREINKNGKSKVFINEEPDTLENLRTVALTLIDIHSQHQNQTLLNSKYHLNFLDRYTLTDHPKLKELLKEYRGNFQNLQERKQELAKLEEKYRIEVEERDFLEFNLKELGELVSQAQYDELKQELVELENQQANTELYLEIKNLLNDGSLSNLRKSIVLLEKIKTLDAGLTKNLEKLSHLESALSTVKDDIFDKLELDQDYSARIDSIHSQLSHTELKTKKYGLTIDQLHQKKEKTMEKLERISNLPELKEKIQQEMDDLSSHCLQVALEIHQLRQKAGLKLQEQVNHELSFLGMNHSSFQVDVRPDRPEDSKAVKSKTTKKDRPELSINGISSVEFLYSPAKEVAAKPLKKIASGGEISRIMLGIKTVLNRKLIQSTIIFDEIDTGVGGETANHLGSKIKEVSSYKQVILITHLPQIARFADQHFVINKVVEKGVTQSQITMLKKNQIPQEISRMLGKKGSKTDTSDASLALAREMLMEAKTDKKSK